MKQSVDRKTILLVEDEALIAMNEAMMLRKEGYDVLLAGSGEEAIAKAAKQTINLILMDIDLGRGRMDGAQAAQEILKEQDIPVVFLSSHTEPDVVEKTEQITSYGYVVKNTGITVLAASIKMAFKLHAAYQAIRNTNQSLSQEITTRKQIEEALRESEEKFAKTFHVSPVILCIARAEDQRFVEVNDAMLRMTGYTRDEIIGHSADELRFWVNPAERAEVLKTLAEKGQVAEREYLFRIKSGEILFCAYSAYMITFGGKKYIFVHIINLTERKRLEETLQDERRMFIGGPTVVFQWAAEAGWPVEYVSPNVLGQFGYSVEDFTNRKVLFAHIVHPGDLKQLAEEVDQYSQSGIPCFEQEYRILRADGEARWLYDFTVVKRGEDGRIASFWGYVQDITARKQAENALRKSQALYQALFDQAGDGVFILDAAGKLISVNQAFARLHGYTSEEMLELGLEGLDVEGAAPVPERMSHILAGETLTFEVEHIHKDGHTFFLEVTVNLVTAGDERLIIATHRDITRRKRAEEALRESEAKYRFMVENISDVLWQMSLDYKFTYSSPADEHQRGYKPEEVVGRSIYDFMTPESREAVLESVTKFNETHQPDERIEPYTYEIEQIRKDGSRIWTEVVSQPVYDEAMNLIVFQGVTRDITTRKRAEEALRQALADKEMLMHELQHRVKNSLAMATSLLALEENNLPDPRSRAIFANTQNRIHSMAAIYEQLYRGGGVDQVHLRHYIQSLVEMLSQSYLPANGLVSIEAKLEDVLLDIKRALPLGLILNELITNALKYAFPQGKTPHGRPGVIRVELTQTAGQVTLRVIDNGAGAKKDAPPTESGMGLNLAAMLAEQLDGHFTSKSENGSGYAAQVSFYCTVQGVE